MRCTSNELIRRENKGWAALAQLVEHIIRNDGVTGSSPVSGTTTLSSRISGFDRANGRSRGYRVGRLRDGLIAHRLWAGRTLYRMALTR